MGKLKGKEYRDLLKPLEEELVAMARWAEATGARILVLFEGRDTAGKGGVINAIASHLNTRQCRVVALAKPSEYEQGQWYFQRYVQHLPTRGEIVLFDRSWYNRAGVEKSWPSPAKNRSRRFSTLRPNSRSCWSRTASSCSSTG